MFFGRKKPQVTPEQVLGVKPVRAVKTEEEAFEGGLRLRLPLQPPKWGKWLFKMPPGSTKTFELDSVGAFVWENIDGKTSVQEIIRRLSKKYNLNLREAQVPTMKFLQMLMKKGLVGVPVERTK